MTAAALARLDSFVTGTRGAVFVRRIDDVLFLRPDKSLRVNRTAAAILGALYEREAPSAEAVLRALAPRLGAPFERLVADAAALTEAIGAVMNEDWTPRAVLRFEPAESRALAYPTLAEIALTYGCQNRCVFCYAASPHRETDRPVMTTDQVRRVIDRIVDEGHVPSLSFTGGEATLRPDLPDLVRYAAGRGLRVNLITNGLRLADEGYARELVAAGLASAQISLEAGDAALHDRIVGRPGAHARLVQGARTLRALGAHVHTNTTLCGLNLDTAEDIVRFVARELRHPVLSMNMVIRTGQATALGRVGVTYAEVGARLPALIAEARAEGVKLVWYSPIPYCVFNPVVHGLGAKSCACVDGILSVDPSGEVLPCSSFEQGIGSLLERSYARIRRGRRARWWRARRWVPAVCRGCPDVDLCAGACPLYWDQAGSFAELPVPGAADPRHYDRWQRARARSRTFGVTAREAGPGGVTARAAGPGGVTAREAGPGGVTARAAGRGENP
jgi:radical SAM protein with 4Fe4S-binding SPASM domain